MQDLLRKLYEGEIRPAEQHESSLEDYAVLQKCGTFSEKLCAIDPQLCEEFRSIAGEYLDAVSQELEKAYTDGFRCGAHMMLEILKEQK